MSCIKSNCPLNSIPQDCECNIDDECPFAVKKSASLLKRWGEEVMNRMDKAFPELSHDLIANNVAMANNFEEAFAMCMHDAEYLKVKCEFIKKMGREGYEKNIFQDLSEDGRTFLLGFAVEDKE